MRMEEIKVEKIISYKIAKQLGITDLEIGKVPK